MTIKLYPLMLNIAGKNALVIGGGIVAARKVRDLVERGAFVTVIAPDVKQSIIDLQVAHPGSIEIVHREYVRGDLEGSLIVFSATDDEKVTSLVFEEASDGNILLNAVDDPHNCGFFVPSWFNRGDLIVSVSTSGISPAFAAKLRREIESIIPENIDDLLGSLHRARSVLRNDPEFMDIDSKGRGNIMKRIVLDDDLLGQLVESCKNDSVEMFLKNISGSMS